VAYNSRLKVAVLLLFVPWLEGCHHGQPKNIDDACEMYRDFPGWLSVGKEVQKRWGTPLSLQLAVIYTESRFEAQAQPKREFMHLFHKSSARGYAQALDSVWRIYVHSTHQLGADRENFSEASDFIGWYTHISKERFGMPYNNTFDHYLAYHEGWAGYAKGSYKRQKWLIQVAREAQRQAARYQKQLFSCGIISKQDESEGIVRSK
jgi:hypothetical protein